MKLSDINDAKLRARIEQADREQNAVRQAFTPNEDAALVAYYAERDGQPIDLEALATAMGRSKWSVAMRASRLGLCNSERPKTDEHKHNIVEADVGRPGPMKGQKRSEEFCEHNRTAQLKAIAEHPERRAEQSIRSKEIIKNHGHPKGMLGKKHSKEHCENLSKRSAQWWEDATPEQRRQHAQSMLTTKFNKYGNRSGNNSRGSWKSAWRTIGGKRIFFRSRWEYNYACYLEFLKAAGQVSDWLHEPEVFWFEKIMRGTRSYLPDFLVTFLDGRKEYHEVKGWMDSRSRTTLRRMRIYHPNVRIVLIDKDRMKSISKSATIIPGWEFAGNINNSKPTGPKRSQ